MAGAQTGMEVTEFKLRYPNIALKRPWNILLAYGKCVHCDLPIEMIVEVEDNHFRAFGYSPENGFVLFTLDHIVPRSKKGSNAARNLQCLCEPCNTKKGNDSETKHFVVTNDTIPADYYDQLDRHRQDKQMKDHYPDWKPYYGL